MASGPTHTPDQLAAVANGGVDVGLGWSVPEQPGITGVVLGEFPLIAAPRAAVPPASRREVAFTDLRARRADTPYLDSRSRAGILHTHVEEVARYDELVVHVGVHPGPIALTSPLSTVMFRPIADAADGVRIRAISHAEAGTDSAGALISAPRSIVGSLDIEDGLT